jgi:hypothetical protein
MPGAEVVVDLVAILMVLDVVAMAVVVVTLKKI